VTPLFAIRVILGVFIAAFPYVSKSGRKSSIGIKSMFGLCFSAALSANHTIKKQELTIIRIVFFIYF
jgi:hypothetical protein